MTNVDNFKTFVKKNPALVNYVKNGTMSWQKFYELYDIYGEDNSIWKDYTTENSTRTENIEKQKTTSLNTFSNILELAKNLDSNKIQDGITSIQKAISLFSDMISKDNTNNSSNYVPRQIYRRFDD